MDNRNHAQSQHHPQPKQAHEQQQQPVKSKEFVKCLAEFFNRDLISIPLIKKYPNHSLTQRCGLQSATLELDTAAYPNIDYIAGNRLSVYPSNPSDHVQVLLKHIVDDFAPNSPASPAVASGGAAAAKGRKNGNGQPAGALHKRQRLTEPWSKFLKLNGRDSVRMALTYVYDITTPPSRDLLRVMAESCASKEQRARLIAISRTDDAWEKWICQQLRTLKSTLEEFSTCKISAKTLFSELCMQQPRQYSISSIKSSKRFRTEILVIQHKFTPRQIAASLQTLKERERLVQQDSQAETASMNAANFLAGRPAVHVNHANQSEDRNRASTSSVRSIRSMVAFGPSPISTQQVLKVPSYSGPLVSLYAASQTQQQPSRAEPEVESMTGLKSTVGGGGGGRATSQTSLRSSAGKATAATAAAASAALANLRTGDVSIGQTSAGKLYDGLCSSYLLNLNPNDYVVCEFVENPRFTLKGNRERPIMMIGQDVGVLAFRPFWQQRALEHDRAQVFYTLFKDLSPKKFGDMQLVCLTGNKSKVEELFRREINSFVTGKVISAASYLNRNHLMSLLESAATSSQSSLVGRNAADNSNGQRNPQKLLADTRELAELGNRICKLLVDNNGCLYTCCDAPMTQAIEILIVESVARNKNLARDRVMALLPLWKGRKSIENHVDKNQSGNKYLFTLENPFESAQIVQEIYDSSI